MISLQGPRVEEKQEEETCDYILTYIYIYIWNLGRLKFLNAGYRFTFFWFSPTTPPVTCMCEITSRSCVHS